MFNVSPQTRVLDKQKSLSFRGLCWFFGNRLYLEKLRFFIFTGTCFLYQRWPWKKIIQKAEIIIVYVLRNLSEKQIKILKGIQSIYFGCFNQAVQDSTGFCSIGRFNQNKIFSTKSKWTDCLLGVVIVHRNVAIGEKDTQIFFLIDAVCKSFADGTVWGYLGIFLFYPCEISINFLRENKLTMLLAIRYRQISIRNISVIMS